jgi:hypothetical protein
VHTRHVEYLLPDYVIGKLEEELRAGVASHLEECPECRAELEVIRRALQSIAGSRPKSPSSAYFSAILPRVRERLEARESLSAFARPLITRFALPLAVGGLMVVLLLHVPIRTNNDASAHNPLRPVLTGVGSEELVEIALDQLHRQSFSGPLGENETSSLLAVPFMSSEYFLADAGSTVIVEDPVLGSNVAEGLEALTDADLDVLVARLSERTSL